MRKLKDLEDKMLASRDEHLRILSKIGRDIIGVRIEMRSTEDSLNRLNPKRTEAAARAERLRTAGASESRVAVAGRSTDSEDHDRPFVPAIEFLGDYHEDLVRAVSRRGSIDPSAFWSPILSSEIDVDFESTRRQRFKRLDFIWDGQLSRDIEEKDILEMNDLKSHYALIGRNIAFGRVDFVFSDRIVEVPLTHEGRRICFMSGPALGAPSSAKGFYMLEGVSSVSLYNISHLNEDKKIIPHLFDLVLGRPQEGHHSFSLFDPTTRGPIDEAMGENLLSAFYSLFKYGLPSKSFVLRSPPRRSSRDRELGDNFVEKVSLSPFPDDMKEAYLNKISAIARTIPESDARKDYLQNLATVVTIDKVHEDFLYLKSVFYHSEQALVYYLRNHLQDIYHDISRTYYGKDVRPLAVIIRIFTQRDMCWNCHRTMFLLSQRDVLLQMSDDKPSDIPYEHKQTIRIPTIFAVVGQESYSAAGKPPSRTADIEMHETPPSIREIIGQKRRLFVRMLTK